MMKAKLKFYLLCIPDFFYITRVEFWRLVPHQGKWYRTSLSDYEYCARCNAQMDRYFVVHGRDGTSIRLEETPWWAHALEQLGGWAAEHVLPGHRLCCDIPDWAFDIGWGRYDWGLGIWEHSLVWRKAKCKGHAPVTYEWVREHFPELGSPFTNGWESDDAMESSREDAGDVVL